MYYLSSLVFYFVNFKMIHYLSEQFIQYFIGCSSLFLHKCSSVHLNKYDAYMSYYFVIAKDQQFFNKYLFYFHYLIYYTESDC